LLRRRVRLGKHAPPGRDKRDGVDVRPGRGGGAVGAREAHSHTRRQPRRGVGIPTV
jgi:hypothetical protein